MTDTASLEIKVLSDQVEVANRRLDTLEKRGATAERATDGLTSAFKRLVGPLLATVSATAAMSKLVSVTREFDKLNAGLITATGSTEKANQAFEALQQFATETPYGLAQAVDGFVKLVNLGLTPSEAALRSYGNTASAMGKDLNQMIEAVADATTGEFERLKEFGIKSRVEGDRVSFIFQGMKTTVANNAAEIEKYLISLGENQFAGAMENRMDSLDGAIANLGDAWDSLFLTISQQGVGDVIEDAVRMATGAIEELTAMIASGEIEGYLDAIAGKFEGWGSDVQETIRVLTRFYKDNLEQFEDEGASTVGFLIDAFRNFPENVRAFIQLMTVEVAAGFDRVIADLTYWKDRAKAIFTDDTAEDVRRRWQATVDAIQEARQGSIEQIMTERDAALQSFEDQVKAAREARKAYDEAQDAKSKVTKDRLAEFKVQGDGSNDGPSKAEQAEAARQAREYESLRRSLLTQEEAIQESYERRAEIIRRNTSEGEVRDDMMARLQKDRDEELAQLEEARQRERDSLYNGLLTEEEMLLQSYERRKEMILENTRITEEERLDLLRRLEQQYTQEMQDAETKRIRTQLEAFEDLFTGLSGLAKNYGGEQSRAYQALFAVSQAFSIAQATMSIATGIAKAQELGWPANLAEMARVAALGTQVMSSISGASFSGAYDKGGVIPAGKVGLVGEYGPEFVQGPATVTSREKTARIAKEYLQSENNSPVLEQTNNIVIQGRPDRRTQSQIARQVGRESSRAMSRN